MNRIVNTIVIIAVTAAMLFSMQRLAVNTWDIVPIVTTTAEPTTAPYQPAGIDHAPWDELQKEYKDIVGYIQIPGTIIDDVVVQGEDNDYYLRKNAKGIAGSYSHEGCYFADFRCEIDKCQNTTIYGHNLMDISRKFGQLLKYESLDFYKQSPIIYFDTPDVVGEWKIFSVFITNNDSKDGVIFYYRPRDFFNQNLFLSFTERCRRRSLYDCPVDIQENDRILTLSTCHYKYSSDSRLVVMARLLREGEDPGVDVEQAKLNEDVLYPEGWYSGKVPGVMPYYADEPLLSWANTTATITTATTTE